MGLYTTLSYSLSLFISLLIFHPNNVSIATQTTYFLAFPRASTIAFGDENRYWNWTHVEYGGYTIEEAHLHPISWLDCRWNLHSSNFKLNTWYKAHIDVKLTSDAFGWTSPVNAKIEMPDGSKQESLIKLDRRENVGFAISLGKFIITNSTTSGVIQFGFYNHETKWKSGLVIRALVVNMLTDE
ncbi:lectin-like [Cucumis sativus]|uniref:lectin-like n=1 Tax=Cucumis sativus TaxID=3659 RepID=UPI0005ECD8C3|nr:lectin-like [Cucumis sativus]KAE8653045.1 hypothetical protein Csa_019733 [Cucumis sativus]